MQPSTDIEVRLKAEGTVWFIMSWVVPPAGLAQLVSVLIATVLTTRVSFKPVFSGNCEV
jgi:hypothetical protein